MVFAVYFSRLFWSTPDSPSLYLVFVALIVFFIHLQFPIHPVPPSPLILIAPTRTLLLATISMQHLKNALLPSVILFGPLMVTSMIVLSLSLDGIPPVMPYASLSVDWTPYPSRIFYSATFLALVLMAFLLFLTLLFKECPISPDFDWSKYGSATERLAKQRWSRLVAHWSVTRNMIPPPLNIIRLLYMLVVSLFKAGR